jgi:hypothetical protein
MPKKELHTMLAALHEELEKTPSVDDQSKALLHDLLGDIRRHLQSAEDPPAPPPGLMDGVGRALRRFEGSHPTFTAILGRISEKLSELGI